MTQPVFDKDLNQLLEVYRLQFGDLPTLMSRNITTAELKKKLVKAFITFKPMDLETNVPKDAVI